MMETTIRCNGLDMRMIASPIIHKGEYRNYDATIDQERRRYLARNKSKFGKILYAGPRFKSNEEVMLRVVSSCNDRPHFDAHQTAWIRAGLQECARADYWYQFEKDWGEHD
jgi:hypothetical protein